jgi:hypothetical protein
MLAASQTSKPASSLWDNQKSSRGSMIRQRSSRHLDAEKAQAFKSAVDRLPILRSHRVEQDSQAVHADQFDFGVNSIEQLTNQTLSSIEVSI